MIVQIKEVYMKKTIYYLMASVFLLFILPWLAVTFVPNDAGMITTVFLLLAVNPVYSIIVGVFAGKNIKTLWWLPIFTISRFTIQVQHMEIGKKGVTHRR